MANTVYGPYTATAWTAGVTPVSAPNQNNLEQQSSIALHGFNGDLIGTGYVLSGCAASGTAGTTTVNIASGKAYVIASDGTLPLIEVTSTTQTTVTTNALYHLYLQPDGTWYWSTSSSPAANSLHIADVTTNGSGQIAAIIDYRPTTIIFLGGAIGGVQLPPTTLTLGNPIAAPVVTGVTATAITGAGMGTGAYKYVITYAFDGGESLQSAAISVTTTGGNNQVSLTGIPTGADPRITRRKIYRTAVGGSTYSWVRTIGDNTTTTYTDSNSDAKIASTTKVPPARSTAGGTLRSGYPWSGVTNNAAYVGTVTGVTFGQTSMVTGDSSTAALFNGTTDKISIPPTGLPSGNQPWSILAIAKPTNATNASDAYVVSLGVASAGQIAYLIQKSSGGWIAGTSGSDTAATGTSSAGAKHLLAATYDGTTLTMNVDGGTTNTATPAARSLTYGNAMIGARGDSTLFFPGTIQKAAIFNYALSAEQIAFYNTLMGGASGNVTFDQQVADDGAIRYYTLGDAVSSTTAAETSRLDTVHTPDGTIAGNLVAKAVNGVATMGSFGVPAIVAQTLNQAVTATGDQIILSYPPPANGVYRVSGYVEFQGSGSQALVARMTYADDIGTPTAYLAVASVGTTNPVLMNGNTTFSTGMSGNLIPVTIYAKTSASIVCHYNNPGGSPNDHVWFLIERLA